MQGLNHYILVIVSSCNSLNPVNSDTEKTHQLLHPDPSKSNKKIKSQKYEALKGAILHILQNESLTHTQLCDATTAYFAKIDPPFEGNVLWYMEGTKLDLEARGVIKRDTGKPQRYSLA